MKKFRNFFLSHFLPLMMLGAILATLIYVSVRIYELQKIIEKNEKDIIEATQRGLSLALFLFIVIYYFPQHP